MAAPGGWTSFSVPETTVRAVDIKLHEDGSESSVALSWSESDDLRWTRVAVGLARVLVQASTDYPDAVAVLDLVAHPAVGNLRMLNDTGDGFLLIGHGRQRAILEVGYNTQIDLDSADLKQPPGRTPRGRSMVEAPCLTSASPPCFAASGRGGVAPDVRLQSCAVLRAIDRFGDLDSDTMHQTPRTCPPTTSDRFSHWPSH